MCVFVEEFFRFSGGTPPVVDGADEFKEKGPELFEFQSASVLFRKTVELVGCEKEFLVEEASGTVVCHSVEVCEKLRDGVAVSADVMDDVRAVVEIVESLLHPRVAEVTADDFQSGEGFADAGEIRGAHSVGTVASPGGAGFTPCSRGDRHACMKEDRHSELFRAFIVRIELFVVPVRVGFVGLQTDETQFAQAVDPVDFSGEVEMSESEDDARMRFHGVEDFACLRDLDAAEVVSAEIHEPDFIERAGVGEFVKPFVIVDQMRMGVDAFHDRPRQMLNFGAAAVARSVAMTQLE